jgi:hypothetical protein
LRVVLNAEYFLQKADECFRLSYVESDIRPELKAIAYEFLAKAVELETRREKAAKNGVDLLRLAALVESGSSTGGN